jgi:uncharacterized phage protein (TIGR02220 family)
VTKHIKEIGGINFTGDVICPIWYQRITKPNGKPHLLAILILSNIITWYKPVPTISEKTGLPGEPKAKFKGDTLQRSYEQYAQLYAVSKERVKEAFGALVSMGLITREFQVSGPEDNPKQIMLIAPDPEAIREITHGAGKIERREIQMFEQEPPQPERKEYRTDAQGIIDYLNEAREKMKGKKLRGYRLEEGKNFSLIRARMREGHGVQEFKQVIDWKVKEWKGSKWEKYLRPGTLFTAAHFTDYLNEAQENHVEKAEKTKVDSEIAGLMA